MLSMNSSSSWCFYRVLSSGKFASRSSRSGCYSATSSSDFLRRDLKCLPCWSGVARNLYVHVTNMPVSRLSVAGFAGPNECHADQTQSVGERFQLRSEEHTSELQSRLHLVCRLLLEKQTQR